MFHMHVSHGSRRHTRRVSVDQRVGPQLDDVDRSGAGGGTGTPNKHASNKRSSDRHL